MVTLDECEHNEAATFFLTVCEVVESEIPNRAYELRIRTPGSAVVPLVVWENSPAATVEWTLGEWYRVETVLVKQWETHTELNATKRTTAEPVENTIVDDQHGESRNNHTGESGDDPPTDSDAVFDDTTAPQMVEPNQVSELYEAFRGLQSVLEAIIEYPESAVSSGETDHPLVQYHAVIKGVIGDTTYLPDGIDGFGTQQADRVPTTMADYRAAYGSESSAYGVNYPTDGSESWITAYQTVETVPLAAATQRALEDHGIVADASVYVRPVAPETETPLPVVAWTAEELAEALSLLSQFQARPPLPWDDESTGAFPIEDVYERVCTVEDIDTDQQVQIPRESETQQVSTTAGTELWTGSIEESTDRCGFIWPPDGDSSKKTQRASCCYRKTWRECDRCIWHADTESKKPIDELRATREAEPNRLHNHLPREILAGAILHGDQLADEVLTGVDFRGADFEGCEFTGAYLKNATFAGADLRGADFSDTTISQVSFWDADLTHARLTGLSLYETDFTGATLTDTDFTDSRLGQAQIENTALEAAVGVDAAGEHEGEVDPPAETKASPSTATEPATGDETTLIVTTDTHVDRNNMGRTARQDDYLKVFGEIIESAIETNADAVVHLGNLFWTNGSEDRATAGVETYLETLAANDIEFCLVQAPKDTVAHSTVLEALEQRDLLTVLDSGWHQVGTVGLFVQGVDAETVSDGSMTPPPGVTTTIAALYDEIPTATSYADASEFEAALELELDLVLTGTQTATSTTTDTGTPLVSPGMPERIIGRSIIDSDPETPGFLQCDCGGGEINTTRHETAARPAVGVRLELSVDATKPDVIDALPADLPTDAAVVFDICGERSTESLSKNEIQQVVKQQVGIARGYEKRTSLDSNDDTNETSPTVTSIAASSVFETAAIKRKVEKLQSRGATREKALSCVSQYVRDRQRDEGLYAVPGVGLTVGYELSTYGITNRDELRTEHLNIIKQIDGVSDHHIEPLVEAVEWLEKP